MTIDGPSRTSARFHLHGGDHDGDAAEGDGGADSGDDGPRVIVDERGEIVCPRPSRRRPGRRACRRGTAELQPGQTRKEIEGVFVIKDEPRLFVPVKAGIAGEKFFEVLERTARLATRSSRDHLRPCER